MPGQGQGRRQDDEEGDHVGDDRADDDVGPAVGEPLGGDRLLGDRGLQVELHPGRDRGSDEGDGEQEVGARHLDLGHHRGAGDLRPVGVHEEAGDDIGQVDDGEAQQHPLHDRVAAPDHQQPDQDRRDRHRDVLGHAEQFHPGRDTGELGDRRERVGDQQKGHRESGAADAEALPDQVGQALPGDHPQPGAHLVDDDQAERYDDQQPQHLEPELGAGLGIGGDAAGVVVGVGGDQAGADDGQQDEDAAVAAEALEHALHFA